MASTREASELVAAASAAGAKLIAIGDSGQLASVQAGGWLGSLRSRFGTRELTEVMRQRDAAEREKLARVHERMPAAYLRQKHGRRELHVCETGAEAEAALVAEWHRREAELGRSEAVMVARDNSTRERLNAAARELLREEGRLGEAIEIGLREFAVGDRVIVRRNDRCHDVDNGMRARCGGPTTGRERSSSRPTRAALRELPIGYVAEHTEHAYALTGHGMQGGTVEWAGVVGAPRTSPRNWSYTALSRAREPTEIYVVAEAGRFELDREEIAPAEKRASSPLRQMAATMRTRDDEDLALDWIEPPGPPTAERSNARREDLHETLDQHRERHVRGALEAPGQHLDSALGARPREGPRRYAWDRAATAIERYRFDNRVRGAGCSRQAPCRARGPDRVPPGAAGDRVGEPAPRARGRSRHGHRAVSGRRGARPDTGLGGWTSSRLAPYSSRQRRGGTMSNGVDSRRGRAAASSLTTPGSSWTTSTRWAGC